MLKEKFKKLCLEHLDQFEGIEVLGFKIKAYTRKTKGIPYTDLFAYRWHNGKKLWIFIGKPESQEEIKEKIKKFCSTNSIEISELQQK